MVDETLVKISEKSEMVGYMGLMIYPRITHQITLQKEELYERVLSSITTLILLSIQGVLSSISGRFRG